MTARWPTARLVEIWNNIPGVTPVSRFRDKKTAAARIWAAVQSIQGQSACKPAGSDPLLSQEIADGTDIVAGRRRVAVRAQAGPALGVSYSTVSPNTTPQVNDAIGDPLIGKKPRLTRRSHKSGLQPRQVDAVNKTTKILELLKQEGGTTLGEIMSVTGWQAHSVRGFLSGTISKKMGLKIDSTKSENQERVYSIRS